MRVTSTNTGLITFVGHSAQWGSATPWAALDATSALYMQTSPPSTVSEWILPHESVMARCQVPSLSSSALAWTSAKSCSICLVVRWTSCVLSFSSLPEPDIAITEWVARFIVIRCSTAFDVYSQQLEVCGDIPNGSSSRGWLRSHQTRGSELSSVQRAAYRNVGSASHSNLLIFRLHLAATSHMWFLQERKGKSTLGWPRRSVR